MKGANADLSPADIDRAAEDLKTCDLILLQLEVPLETVYAAIAFGKRHGVKTVLNPAPATPALDVDRIRDVTFFIPNETELAILTGMPVDTESNIATAARSLLDKGFRTVIVTLGSRGALLTTTTDARKIEPVPVKAVDTTGAGDAFVGSFARFFAGGRPSGGCFETSGALRGGFGHPARHSESLRVRGSIQELLRDPGQARPGSASLLIATIRRSF